MSESLNSGSISTQLERVAELARKHPERAFMSLHHVIDVEWLREAYRRTRKDAAVGVDGQTAEEYARDLESNRCVTASVRARTEHRPCVACTSRKAKGGRVRSACRRSRTRSSSARSHEVLDKWFESDVKPRLRGRAQLVRYADDFVIAFELETDARRVMDVLPKRFGKYALTLHPAKTRLVKFTRPRQRGADDDDGPGSFDLLGFNHHWTRSRRGNWVVERTTMRARFTRALAAVRDWCRAHRHLPIAVQCKALGRLAYEVRRMWHKWLARRSQRGMDWNRFNLLLRRYPLPPPRVVHSVLRSPAARL